MKTCSECTHMLLEKEHEHDNDGKYWCEFKGNWKRPEDAECWNFCQAYSRSSDTAKSARDYSKRKQEPGGCFITTIVCHILGLDDRNSLLMLFRDFRDNYLQKNMCTIPVLKEYDIVGPIISEKIFMDDDRDNLAKGLFTNYLSPVFLSLENKDYMSAIVKYTAMVKWLIVKYNLDYTVLNNDYYSDCDPSKDYSMYGHGRKK